MLMVQAGPANGKTTNKKNKKVTSKFSRHCRRRIVTGAHNCNERFDAMRDTRYQYNKVNLIKVVCAFFTLHSHCCIFLIYGN